MMRFAAVPPTVCNHTLMCVHTRGPRHGVPLRACVCIYLNQYYEGKRPQPK